LKSKNGKYIECSQSYGIGRDITFVLGSGVGLDESLKSVANHLVSLSKLTFSHNFARVLLEEQLYRAFTIIKGKSYHK
jgi:23S rRNA (pseudouridine1915-N3)-methyltransferase